MTTQNSVFVDVEQEVKTITFPFYFQVLWSYQAGKLDDAQLLSYGRLGLHIWQTLHNPDNKVMKNGLVTDKKIAHPIFALTEQEEIVLSGKYGRGALTGETLTQERKATVKLDSFGEHIAALRATIDHWPKSNNANSKNTWVRYWLVCHALSTGLADDFILGPGLRNHVGLASEDKYQFIMARVMDNHPDAIRLAWEQQKQENKAKAETAKATA